MSNSRQKQAEPAHFYHQLTVLAIAGYGLALLARGYDGLPLWENILSLFGW